MLRSLSPARHLSAPRYNFIFHITLPDSAIGSIHSLVPGLSDLSVPFLPHTTSAPQSSKPRLARPSMLTFSMQPQQPAQCSGGIKATRFITQVALGKRKTALAPPWLLTLPTHHLYPEKKGQSKAASPSRRAKGGDPHLAISKRSPEKGVTFEVQPRKRLSTYLSANTPVSR